MTASRTRKKRLQGIPNKSGEKDVEDEGEKVSSIAPGMKKRNGFHGPAFFDQRKSKREREQSV